jgi:general secretion pathway protein C
MQQYVKKYFWVGGIILVVLCALLAAKTVNHIVAGKYLKASSEPAKFQAPAEPRQSSAAKRRSKQGQPLAMRNMFCSDCQPEELVADDTQDVSDPDAVPLTSLPLQLVATNVSSNPRYSFATIQNSTSESQGAYWVEQSIPGAGEVVKITGKYVDFRNPSSNRLERISLVDEPRVVRAPPEPRQPPQPAVGGKQDELSAMIDDGVKMTGENKYEIDRSLVDKVLANPMSVASGARIVPSVKDGKANGFKLYAIRPNSVYAKIGLRNGDTLHAINGFDLTTPDKALEVYTKVKEASNLSVSVTRRGQPLNIDYSIR